MPKKILLVDDEPEILEICRDYLKASAFDVVTAKDGVQGLAATRREKPDLIVLDWMMPEMDGIDVCRAIPPRERRAHHHADGAGRGDRQTHRAGTRRG